MITRWAELCRLVKRQGVLFPGEGQPLPEVNGLPSACLFYTWHVTLTGQGLTLAGRCLLDRLGTFEGRQLATYGQAGMPLLAACLALGGGHYTGLFVRRERKSYGSLRRVEGRLDPRRPVVVVDDTLGTGTSVFEAVAALEKEGLRVEGVLALAHMPGYGAAERLRSLGYRVEWVFDAQRDLNWRLRRIDPDYRRLLPGRWGRIKIPDGLEPAVAARKIAEAYLATGQYPKPPRSLDQCYHASGGVFVSFRDRSSEERIWRDGFWHFNPEEAELGRDLVLATVRTLAKSPTPIAREDLAGLKIGVTLCGPLERIRPAQLDFSRYGIVVKNQLNGLLGGALPNTQYFTNEIEQYHHARVKNAGVAERGPHELYRHAITKCLEPGTYWLPFGCPIPEANHWTQKDEIGERLTRRARALLSAAMERRRTVGEAVPDDLIPAPISAVSVTLFHRGIIGCGMSWDGPLDQCLQQAIEAALNGDPFEFQDSVRVNRAAGRRSGAIGRGSGNSPEIGVGGNASGIFVLKSGSDLTWGGRTNDARKIVGRLREVGISVSILHDREWLGNVPLSSAAEKAREGLDSLSVTQGDRTAVGLPFAMIYRGWSRERNAQELLAQVSLDDRPHAWAIHSTTTWLRFRENHWRLRFGFPDRSDEDYPIGCWPEDIRLLGDYLFRHLRPEGLPEYGYDPFKDERVSTGSAGRMVYGLATLREAGEYLHQERWIKAAERGLAYCLEHLVSKGREQASLEIPGWEPSALADCALLAATAPDNDRQAWHKLAKRVKHLFHSDGRITDQPLARGLEADHDYLPGAALKAMAHLSVILGEKLRRRQLARCLEWYRRRFRLVQSWEMVGWQTQGWAALHAVTGYTEAAELVYEIADFTLDWQHEKSGAFLTEWAGGGFSVITASLAESLADAWGLAHRNGEEARCQSYGRACREALRFINRLILRPEDGFCLQRPEIAVGGVRRSLTSTEVRVDYVGHALMALLKAHAMALICRPDNASIRMNAAGAETSQTESARLR